jgi:hypothetical protein
MKGSATVPEKGVKRDYRNRQRILFSTLYQILLNIHLSRLTSFVDEIIEDYRYRF